MRDRAAAAAVAVVVAASLTGCPVEPPASGGKTASGTTEVTLLGAGATFPYPLYSKWAAEHERARPGTRINYQSIGSGAGIRQLLERTVDFGASDAPLTDETMAKAGTPVLHVPMTLGAVVATYNLPGLSGELKLTGDLLARIYLGEIKTWNDAALAAENPGLALPSRAIVPVSRSDGSGTTFVLADYLCHVSPTFKEKVGKGTSLKFPAGIGAKGNEGVTGQVKQTEGAIGYVEYAYAKVNGMAVASIKNKAGKFVAPSVEGVTAAAASAKLQDDLRVSIVDAPGDAAYPISSFTWIVVVAEMKDFVKAVALAGFLDWALGQGQSYAPDLHYAPLPKEVVERAKQKVRAIATGGKPALVGN